MGARLEEGRLCYRPSYANRLITIIEDYELYKYDSRGMSKRDARSWEKELKKKPWLANPHQVYIANDIAYVVRATETPSRCWARSLTSAGRSW